MQTSKEGIRTTNQKVLRAAPCSVEILVDRGFAPKQVSDSEMKQQVAALFSGGPDDCEALADSSQMAMHPDVKLTVFRFLPVTSKELQASISMVSNEEDEILMDIMTHVTEKDADEAFLANFCNRFFNWNVTYGNIYPLGVRQQGILINGQFPGPNIFSVRP